MDHSCYNSVPHMLSHWITHIPMRQMSIPWPAEMGLESWHVILLALGPWVVAPQCSPVCPWTTSSLSVSQHIRANRCLRKQQPTGKGQPAWALWASVAILRPQVGQTEEGAGIGECVGSWGEKEWGSKPHGPGGERKGHLARGKQLSEILEALVKDRPSPCERNIRRKAGPQLQLLFQGYCHL